jgi:hypothetical protein
MTGGTDFITERAYKIGQTLQAGNQKSKDLGLLLIHSAVLAKVKPTTFIKMVDEIAPVYQELNQFWNVEVFAKMKGVKGSDEFNSTDDKFSFKAVEVGKGKEETGIDMEAMVDGIDPEGFNNLQVILPFMKEVPTKTPEDFLVFKLFETIFWAIFICTFKEDYIPKLTEIMSRPEFSPK